MADNLESLLMNDDDSSSGESDSGAPNASRSHPPAAAPPQQQQQPQQQRHQTPTQTKPVLSHNERLKSLYSPASKGGKPASIVATQQQQRQVSQQQQQQVPPPPPLDRQAHQPPPVARHMQPPSSRQMQQQQLMKQQQQQQLHASSRSSHPTSVPQQQQQQAHRSSSQPRSSSSSRAEDPFEPTPVSKILQRTPKPAAHYSTTGSVSSSSSRQTTVPTSNLSHPSSNSQAAAAELKKQKERFLIFTRVLMKYLEQKDPALHVKVKAIIKDCADRNKRQEPGYESVTASMKGRLKAVVSEQYWKRAEAYLDHFLAQKKGPNASSSTTSSSSATAQDEQRKKAALAAEMQRRKMQKAATAAASRPSPTLSSMSQQQQQQPKQQRPSQQQQASSSTSASSQTKYPHGAPGSRPVSTSATASTYPKVTRVAAPVPAATKNRSTSKSPKNSASLAPQQQQQAQSQQQALTSRGGGVSSEPPPVREYSELMEWVDHAVTLDWTTAGLVLGGRETLSEEQARLLAGPPVPRTVPLTLSWGRRNVLGPRAAYSRLRILTTVPSYTRPLPGAPPESATTSSSTPVWWNEDRAEQDPALAALSNGLQLYLTQVLTKALHGARQRQQLDGLRLWHNQAAAASTTAPPALTIRLGCDVKRQVAATEGNAAWTVKRMEEALARRSRQDETDEPTSMSALSLQPKLAHGVQDAVYAAKRSWEVYGGKDAREPPLGRLFQKRARLTVQDFVVAAATLTAPGRCQAANAAATFSF